MSALDVTITPLDLSNVPLSSTQTSTSASQQLNATLATATTQAQAAQSPQTTSTQPYGILSQNNASIALRYPLDLPVYYMGFLFANYQRTSINSPVKLTSYQTVALPVPANLQDHQHMIYTEENLGPLLGVPANKLAKQTDAGQRGVAGNMAALSNPLQSGAQQNVLQQTGSYLSSELSYLAGQLGQSAQQFAGQTPNPFLQVYFVGPAYKRHQYNWRFSPNNPLESQAMKNIVDTFRYAQLPKIGGGDGAFLMYPNIVYPYLSPNPNQLYVFQPCVIEDSISHYAPNGVPAFMAGTQFSESIDFSVNLLEITQWSKDTFYSLPGYLQVNS